MKNKKIVQETVLKQQNNGEDDASNEAVPQESSTDNSGEQDPFANWPELTRLIEGDAPVESLFEKGWKPLLKAKINGKQYMTLRLHGKDPETGDRIDTERSIGFYDPENPVKWNALIALYEEWAPSNSLPSAVSGRSPQFTNQPPAGNRSSVLTTKVGRIAPIAPTVQIKLGTLQWYTWVQQTAGYTGTLDDFINESVDTLFREHYKLELAVIVQGDEKN